MPLNIENCKRLLNTHYKLTLQNILYDWENIYKAGETIRMLCYPQ